MVVLEPHANPPPTTSNSRSSINAELCCHSTKLLVRRLYRCGNHCMVSVSMQKTLWLSAANHPESRSIDVHRVTEQCNRSRSTSQLHSAPRPRRDIQQVELVARNSSARNASSPPSTAIAFKLRHRTRWHVQSERAAHRQVRRLRLDLHRHGGSRRCRA
jgi:hypothetical protein